MRRIFTASLSSTRIRSILCAARFGSRTTCPSCSYQRGFWRLSDGRWQCRRCGRRFGLLSDTCISRTTFSPEEIYELLHWFELGLTDNTIAQRLDVSYARVHRFLMQVRGRIRDYEESCITLLDGEVEVDESYFGARFRNRRRRTRERLRKRGLVKRGRGAKYHMQPVFGIYERLDGIVYIQPVEAVSKEILQRIIKEKVSIETVIYSDTFYCYNGLDRDYPRHERINHAKGFYADGSVSINGIEGFWGYAKEGLLKHHGVSSMNFLSYLKEQEFRFNNRHLGSAALINKPLEVILEPIHSAKR
jgi:transposase